jgi:hypothetical protein
VVSKGVDSPELVCTGQAIYSFLAREEKQGMFNGVEIVHVVTQLSYKPLHHAKFPLGLALLCLARHSDTADKNIRYEKPMITCHPKEWVY